MDRILAKQLATLQTDHIDYYLLHSLGRESWEKLLRLGALEFLDTARASGKIKNAGSRFTGISIPSKQIVDVYDWQFCQIHTIFSMSITRQEQPGSYMQPGKISP